MNIIIECASWFLPNRATIMHLCLKSTLVRTNLTVQHAQDCYTDFLSLKIQAQLNIIVNKDPQRKEPTAKNPVSW